MGHGYDVRPTWTGSTQLTIEYPRDATMLNRRSRFQRQVGDRPLDVKLAPVESRDGRFLDGGNECLGGRLERGAHELPPLVSKYP